MLVKALIVAVLLVAVFSAYVSFSSAHFSVERSAVIRAPADRIFPHLNEPKAFDAWNPFLKGEAKVERSFSGPTAGVGAVSQWRGPGNAGTCTITESRAPELVRMRMDYEAPFRGTNMATFRLTPHGESTNVTWVLTGDASFVPRMLTKLGILDMDKMIGGQFETGLADLKTIAEKENP